MTFPYQEFAREKMPALLADLKDLISIDSVRNMDLATPEYPVGPGPVKALEKFLAIAARDGFQTENIDNYAGVATFGEGDQELGVAVHVDVVPPDEGWSQDPFTPWVKGGRVYGRGASDNKGPALAAYYALLALKEAGFQPKKKITLIIGTDEETDWVGVKYYLKKRPAPDWVFSPDSSFPIVTGQDGLAVLKTAFTGEEAGSLSLDSFSAGQATNMIPAAATAAVSGEGSSEIAAAYPDFLAQSGLSGQAEATAEGLLLTLEGVSAHASVPWEGKNGACLLASFLRNFPFAGRAKNFLDFAGQLELEDYYGEKIGIANTDPEMGKSINCPAVFRYQKGQEAFIKSDIRYSRGTRPEKMSQQLNAKFGAFCQTTFQPYEDFEKPHFVSSSDPFVKTLLSVYEKQTGQAGETIISAGANYGRFFKNGVGYGPAFPGSLDTAHAIDESVSLDELEKSLAIYAEAIYELSK
ncbi:dipeptidase PepV [Lactobacillus nasalidis]|uniref:Dipeptidase PepV n=3 Tax=Lactobacillus nasalidis TaxID=2797258 RepID=A0ABQ3W8T0_9LACO|nr:dipeptidase PepV [Lactobacillus nasalidis]GHW00592.1 dipeptidase PepV [Lactobacillus nasalidis]